MTTKDTTNQPLPLYKRLDEEIKQSGHDLKWFYSPIGGDGAIVSDQSGFIMEAPTDKIGEYTALAVNNLAVCGDAMDETINRLQYCIDLWEMPEEAIAMIKEEIDNLAKALARIS